MRTTRLAVRSISVDARSLIKKVRWMSSGYLLTEGIRSQTTLSTIAVQATQSLRSYIQ